MSTKNFLFREHYAGGNGRFPGGRLAACRHEIFSIQLGFLRFRFSPRRSASNSSRKFFAFQKPEANFKKNRDLQVVMRPLEITPEKEDLFERHKRRFTYGVPESIYNFLPRDADDNPCEELEICVYRGEELIAASFFDVGERAVSSVYAIFAPEECCAPARHFYDAARDRMGAENKKEFFYQGYCFEEDSFYDYKKRFRGVEKFDWKDKWESFDRKSRRLEFPL